MPNDKNLVPFGNYNLKAATPETDQLLRDMAKDAEPPRMKMLGQGNPGFVIADEIIPEFRGIVLHFVNSNVLLVKKPGAVSREDVQPVCWSWDGINSDPAGTDVKSASCITCPMNMFGSAEEGKGKACKNTMRLFVLPENALLPVLWSLPPTSIRRFRQLLGKMMLRGIMYNKAVIKFSTISTRSTGGNQISVATFSLEGPLKEDSSMSEFLARMTDIIIPLFKGTSEGKKVMQEAVVDSSELETEEDDSLPQ